MLLGMALGVIALACLLRIREERLVILPVLGLPLPELCSFRRLWGLDCPGCGMTRCFISLTRADFVRAWRYNAPGLLLFGLLAFQVPYRLVQIARIRRGLREYELHGWAIGTLVVFCVWMLLAWVWRLASGMTSV